MKYTFEFSEQEINMIAQAIGEMPFRVAQPLMNSIQEQVNAQQAQPEPESE